MSALLSCRGLTLPGLELGFATLKPGSAQGCCLHCSPAGFCAGCRGAGTHPGLIPPWPCSFFILRQSPAKSPSISWSLQSSFSLVVNLAMDVRHRDVCGAGPPTWISRAWYSTTRPSRMTVDRLMRHFRAKEYRDAWGQKGQGMPQGRVSGTVRWSTYHRASSSSGFPGSPRALHFSSKSRRPGRSRPSLESIPT